MIDLIKERTKRSDDVIVNLLEGQCLDKNSRYYGSVIDPETGYAEPSRGISIAGYFILRYCNPFSRFYGNELFLERAYIAIKNSLSRMHSDNTFDLTCTNPHDPTSIAFSVRIAAPALRLLKKNMQNKPSPSDIEVKVYNIIIDFLTKSVDGMVGNGFHTPNHRWVVASALSFVMNILDMPELMDEINKFLVEGIDCDEYGEYAERSISIYNLTNNESLIILAHELNRPDLLEHVRRNLYMSTKYFEPDGSLYTLNSTRQDFGTRTYPFTLFESYMVMAHIDNNPQFAYIAKVIFDMTSNNPYDINDMGYYSFAGKYVQHMEYTNPYSGEVKIEPFDYTHYNSFFPNSDIARIRDGEDSMTVLAKNVMAVKYMHKFLSIHMMFLSEGYIEFERIEKIPEEPIGYRMYGKDAKTEVILDCIFKDDGAKISIEAKADQPYPCAAILMFDKEGIIQGNGYSIKTKKGKNLLVKNSKFNYMHFINLHPYSLTVESDFVKDDYSGICVNKAMPTDKNAFTVFLTAEAPFKKTIFIKKG